MEEEKCPICKGSGLIPQKCESRKSDVVQRKKKVSKVLHKKGYSYREIMKILGYRSPRTIFKWVNDIK